MTSRSTAIQLTPADAKVELRDLLDSKNSEAINAVYSDLCAKGWSLVRMDNTLTKLLATCRGPLENFFAQPENEKVKHYIPPIWGYTFVDHKESLRVLTSGRFEGKRLPPTCSPLLYRLASFLDVTMESLVGVCAEKFFNSTPDKLGSEFDLPLLKKDDDSVLPFGMLDVAHYFNKGPLKFDVDIEGEPPINCTAHYDPGLLSLSMMSTSSGLELQDPTDGKWYAPPSLEHDDKSASNVAILWTGEAAVQASGGKMKPAIHRVVFPSAYTSDPTSTSSFAPRIAIWYELCTAQQEPKEAPPSMLALMKDVDYPPSDGMESASSSTSPSISTNVSDVDSEDEELSSEEEEEETNPNPPKGIASTFAIWRSGKASTTNKSNNKAANKKTNNNKSKHKSNNVVGPQPHPKRDKGESDLAHAKKVERKLGVPVSKHAYAQAARAKRKQVVPASKSKEPSSRNKVPSNVVGPQAQQTTNGNDSTVPMDIEKLLGVPISKSGRKIDRPTIDPVKTAPPPVPLSTTNNNNNNNNNKSIKIPDYSSNNVVGPQPHPKRGKGESDIAHAKKVERKLGVPPSKSRPRSKVPPNVVGPQAQQTTNDNGPIYPMDIEKLLGVPMSKSG